MLENALVPTGAGGITGSLSVPKNERAGAEVTRAPSFFSRKADLSRQQKAAIIMRLLRDNGAPVNLTQLDVEASTRLLQATASLGHVDTETTSEVVLEFLSDLSRTGIAFQGGLEGAIDLLKDHVAQDAIEHLRATETPVEEADPWDELAKLEPEVLAPFVARETPQVGAIVISKLKASAAAAVLAEIEPALASEIARAVSHTGGIAAQNVHHIGVTLAAITKKDGAPKAFEGDPIERLGAILNFASGANREAFLKSFEAESAQFAEKVRAVMFTFADIPDRLGARDVSSVVRAVDNTSLVTALAGAQTMEPKTAEYILSNLSKRLANQLREEVVDAGEVAVGDAERAMNVVIQAIRDLERAGDLTLTIKDDA